MKATTLGFFVLAVGCSKGSSTPPPVKTEMRPLGDLGIAAPLAAMDAIKPSPFGVELVIGDRFDRHDGGETSIYIEVRDSDQVPDNLAAAKHRTEVSIGRGPGTYKSTV